MTELKLRCKEILTGTARLTGIAILPKTPEVDISLVLFLFYLNKQDAISSYGEMPKFLDVYSFHSLGESTGKELQRSPPDEFGVNHLNILYNKASDLCFCFLEAPNRKAVEKHHGKVNLKCDG